MKQLEFETSKGRFLVSESDEHYDYRFIGLLSRITEEQARKIVDEELDSHLKPCYKSYTLTEIEHVEWEDDFIHYSAIESLHSLLKSKGIHLFENPLKNTLSIQSLEGSQKHSQQIKEAEQKTFYNPYIFIKHERNINVSNMVNLKR